MGGRGVGRVEGRRETKCEERRRECVGGKGRDDEAREPGGGGGGQGEGTDDERVRGRGEEGKGRAKGNIGI